MQLLLVSITAFAHLLVPALFVAWVGFSRATNRAYWLAVLVLAASYVFLIHVAGAGWHMFGFYWMVLFWAALLATAGRFAHRRWSRLPWWPRRAARPWLGLATVVLVALFFASATPSLITARAYEGDAVELRFPLRSGTFHVGHGGANEAVNHHHSVPAQRYALDIVALNGLGIRAQGLAPTVLAEYEIYGMDVLAPCDGEVLATRDGLEDLTPPKMDPENTAGNYVALHCKGVTVLLAHLQNGSVRVQEGIHVEAGVAMAKVGNTGNTSEPHLHIHAARGRLSDHQELGWTGNGVPMLFGNRFLVRNDRVVRADR